MHLNGPDKPQPDKLNIEWQALSDLGRTRRNNQDFLGVHESKEGGFSLFVVADGMGGHAAGEVASKTAVKAVIDEFVSSSAESDGLRLAVSIEKANTRVRDVAKSDISYQGMGTTCVALVMRRATAIIAHVGDSRAYLIRDGRIRQLTRDHSPIWDMVEKGEITKEEARSHPSRNMISRSLGIKSTVSVELHPNPIDICSGDIFMLCSDGLTSKLDDFEILNIVMDSVSLKDGCKKLISRANEKGGDDNISVILVKAISGQGREKAGTNTFAWWLLAVITALILVGMLLFSLGVINRNAG